MEAKEAGNDEAKHTGKNICSYDKVSKFVLNSFARENGTKYRV